MMKPTTSKAMLDVWEAKRIVVEETRNLKGAAYFRYVREQAARAFPGIERRKADSLAMRLAEDKAPYGQEK